MRFNRTRNRYITNKVDKFEGKLAKAQVLAAKRQILKSPDLYSSTITELAETLGLDYYEAFLKVLTIATPRQQLKIRELFGLNTN